jgi:hypothetical protein
MSSPSFFALFPPISEHRPRREWKRKPLAQFDVFVKNLIGLAQDNPMHLKLVCQVLLHTINELFCPINDQDSEYRTRPSSMKKLAKGDATWDTHKVILSWFIDTLVMTIELLVHRQSCRAKSSTKSTPTRNERPFASGKRTWWVNSNPWQSPSQVPTASSVSCKKSSKPWKTRITFNSAVASTTA